MSFSMKIMSFMIQIQIVFYAEISFGYLCKR